MTNLRFSRPTARFLGAGLLLALLLAAPYARAAKPLTNVTLEKESYASVLDGQGNAGTLDNGSLADVFDGNEASCGKIRSGGLGVGAAIVVEFPLELLGDNKHLVYADTVALNMVGNAKYSLYFSENGTDWEPVSGVERMSASSNAVHNVKERVKSIKLVFDTLSGTVELFEFQVWGYVSSLPQNISRGKQDWAKIYNSDGSLAGGDGTGGFTGGAGIKHWFDGRKRTDTDVWGGGGTWLGRLGDGAWLIFAVTNAFPEGCFVSDVSISQCNDFKYSIYWLDDDGWHPVEEAMGVSKIGEGIYGVNKIAKEIKIFFNETGGYSLNISEIEIWGMVASDVYCTHPSYTEWTEVEGSATCLDPGIDERFCTQCGKRFTMEQDVGLGHDFVSHLLVPGAYRKFGSGYVDCSRCDWRLDFPLDPVSLWDTQPLDLVTNRVNGQRIGGVARKGQFPFTEISVTSTGNGPGDPSGNWGVSPAAMIDGNWSWGWGNYWYSIKASTDPNPHVDYVFGTEIDLAWIDFSTDNANYTNLFFSVDDATGEETLIAAVSAFTADETHQEGVEQIVFAPVSFAATEDGAPDATKTYYAVATNQTGAFYVATNGLEAFEADVDYYEISPAAAAYLVLDDGKYKPANVADGFATNATYVVQSATADKYYTQETSEKYVSAGALTEFSATTAYYRTTGVTTGNDLPVIVDAHTDVTRLQLRFYRQPVKHLRLRQVKSDGTVRAPMYVSELHPWGTVAGAGDLQYRKETLMILR